MSARADVLQRSEAGAGPPLAQAAIAHQAIDAALAARDIRFDAALAASYAAGIERHPAAAAMAAVKARSMLSLQTLLMLRAFAIEAQGTTLEIGAYMGGGAVAACFGLQAAGRGRVISVDRGGAYPTHPHLPSADIFTDWRATTGRFGVADRAALIEGFTYDADTRRRIRAAIGEEPVRLLVMDADGFVFAHLEGLADLLAPDCLVVIDDYAQPDHEAGPVKAAFTRAAVDRAVAAGVVEPYALLPWSTWFGRLTPAFAGHAPALIAAETHAREAFLLARDGDVANRRPPGGFQPRH